MLSGSLPLGWVVGSNSPEKYRLPLSTLLRHSVVCGTTGFGKSGLLLSVLLSLLKKHPHIGVVLVDCKGETAQELRDRFLPALTSAGLNLDPSEVCCVEPFGPNGVRLNPLALTGIERPIQVQIAAQLIESLIDGGLGSRMQSILTGVVAAVLDANVQASFLTVLRVLTDTAARAWLIQRLPHGESRLYMERRLSQEPSASIQALAARLEWLLSLPVARGVLCAGGSLTGRDLIESRLTIIDLGGAPMGFVSLGRCLGSLIFNLITAGIFSRPTAPAPRPVIVVCDEWQELVRLNHQEVERLLSLGRFKRVGLMLANQTLSQINEVSPALTRSLLTNVGFQVNFRPQSEDIRHLAPLLPISGNCIDPRTPDRLLSPADEQKVLVDQLTRLPPRTALISDRIAGRAQVIRTMNLPYAHAANLSADVDEEVRRAFRRSRHGSAHSQLLAESRASDPLEPADHHPMELVGAEGGERAHRSRRTPPKLVLP